MCENSYPWLAVPLPLTERLSANDDSALSKSPLLNLPACVVAHGTDDSCCVPYAFKFAVPGIKILLNRSRNL